MFWGQRVQAPEELVPTFEWQVILEGQSVPAGLEISIDLQTGLKKAFLTSAFRFDRLSPWCIHATNRFPKRALFLVLVLVRSLFRQVLMSFVMPKCMA